MKRQSATLWAVLAAVAACDSASTAEGDAGHDPRDGASSSDARHASPLDAEGGHGDTGSKDASIPDGTASDATRRDAPGTDASGRHDADSIDAGSLIIQPADASPYDPPVDTSPITGLAAEAWTWVPIAGALCRDGSSTGIGVNLSSASPNLMIFLEGGGECINAYTCAHTPSTFGSADLTAMDGGVGDTQNSIFDRTLATNPLKSWSFVFVPYCTGDLHGGNNPGASPADYPTPQQYVGYVDMALALARIVPTFPNATKVLLAGSSAGGAGVEVNYFQTAQAFTKANPSVTVDALDDSGPPMPDPYLSDCLQTYWAELFRYDRTVLTACPTCAGGLTNTAIVTAQQMAKHYPGSTFGVLDSIDDKTISTLYAFGDNNCANILSAVVPTPVPQATFESGQIATRTELAAYANPIGSSPGSAGEATVV